VNVTVDCRKLGYGDAEIKQAVTEGDRVNRN